MKYYVRRNTSGKGKSFSIMKEELEDGLFTTYTIGKIDDEEEAKKFQEFCATAGCCGEAKAG